MKQLILLIIFLLQFCSNENSIRFCDSRSETFKSEIILRLALNQTGPFCFFSSLRLPSSRYISSSEIQFTVKGLVEENLNLVENISGRTLTFTQTASADLNQTITGFTMGSNFRFTATRPSTHISCTVTPSEGVFTSNMQFTVQCSHICTLNYSTIARKEYSTPFLEELQKQAKKGSSGTETIQTFHNLGSTVEKIYGTVLAPNENIYTNPFTNLGILKINTNTNSVSTLGSVTVNTHGGVLGPNGLIYMMNQSVGSLQVFNPTTETLSTPIPMPNVSVAGIYSPNTDRIYTPELVTLGTVYSINPNTNTVSSLTGTKNQQYYGCALAQSTGMIYCASFGGCTTTCPILKINPDTNTYSEISFAHTSGSFMGAVYAPNDKIYLLPYNSTAVAILDPQNDSVNNTTITGVNGSPGGANKWASGVLAPNGKIYVTPENDDTLLIIDTNTNTFNTSTISNLNIGLLGINAGKFAGGGKLAANGFLYLSTRRSQFFLTLNTRANGSYCTSIRLSPNFNKF